MSLIACSFLAIFALIRVSPLCTTIHHSDAYRKYGTSSPDEPYRESDSQILNPAAPSYLVLPNPLNTNALSR